MVIQVREGAILSCEHSQQEGIGFGVIKPATFDWLLELQQKWLKKTHLFRLEGKQRLKLCSLVGYLQSPAGEAIEILPKTNHSEPEDIDELRSLLQRMLRISMGLQRREVGAADLLRMKQPLHEWIFSEFLKELAELIRRGLRFDYFDKEEECTYIRGQLDVSRQLRQTPDKMAQFHVRYAEFSPQRIENRLLRTGLDYVLKLTKSHQNWRLAHTLSHQLIDIEPVSIPLSRIGEWEDGKYLLGYRLIKPWCQLILEQLNPNFQQGQHRGVALIFPMEQLFEEYLGYCLNRSLKPEFELSPQAKRHRLVSHTPIGGSAQEWFLLKPDFLIEQGLMSRVIIDAKWKLLHSLKATAGGKYDIDQSDLYQMFAYGHKYLNGQGKMMLVYPSNDNFKLPLPVFHFSDHLSLWCVPLNLFEGALVAGDWQESFGCFHDLEQQSFAC